MLLSLMRKHAKSWLIKFLIGMIAIVFVFYFGYSFRSSPGLKIAYVNGELISGVDYQKVYRKLLEGLQRDYGSVWSDNLIKVFDLRNKALTNIINEKLVGQEAKRIGLDVTEEEIQQKIMAYPSFQFNGRFDEGRYRSLLLNNRMEPEDFERGIAQELLQSKVEQILVTFLPVTDNEVLDQFNFSNQKVKVSFVKFPPDDFKATLEPDESGMEKYFEEHKEEYRIPDKIKIAYLAIDPEDFEEEVKATDHEINNYYEDNLAKFKEEKQVKARHILFKLDRETSDEDEKKVKEKALEVLEKAKGGEDFTELAKAHSEGPTAEKGGGLGFFPKGQMVKAFEETAFNLKKGDISDLVKTEFGYHIIKVEDIKEAKTKSLEEARKEISDTLTKYAAMDLAHEKALSLIDQMPYEVELAEYAAEHGLSTKDTGLFSQADEIPEIGGEPKLLQTLFSLDKNGTSDLIEHEEMFYIFQVTDKEASHLPELSEVSDKLKVDYVAFRAKEEAKSKAGAYLKKLKEGADWEEVAKENGLKPETTDFFTRTDYISQVGYAPELQEASFGLGEDKRYADRVFENDQGVFVIRWEADQGIDEEEYQKKKQEYRNALTVGKHQAVIRDWLEYMRSKAEIEIVNPVDQ